jgi:outer membrane receptor protein involved in Fe transport
MKAHFNYQQSVRLKIPFPKQHAYWAAIGLASMACGSLASAQTTNTPTAPAPVSSSPTNAISGSATNVTQLQETTVVGRISQSRTQVSKELGGMVYVQNADQIASGSQGDNAPVNELILRAPGVAQDSAVNGDLHVRGEHANLQYRINGILLPEGISGFGLELDPRFIESLKFITGALPAQYGYRTAGVVDITTKSGAFEEGATGEIYGGSHDTVRPSFEFAGSTNNLSYFVDGSYEHNSLGIENPTANHEAIHDNTDQGKMFSYLSYVLDDTSRLNLMLSASDSNFQVPNTPGQAVGTAPGGEPWNVAGSTLPANFDSAALAERQNEQNYYAVLTYQKSVGDLNFQVSATGRNSNVHFMPDTAGDLYFNGVASDVDRDLFSGGLQADATYQLGERHTIRFGGLLIDNAVRANSTTTVFGLNGAGNPVGAPRTITDNNNISGIFAGLYVQDEWKIFNPLTLNFGLRFDDFNSSFDNENQWSPRVSLVYQPVESTVLHAGYSRYFTPPPVESIAGTDITLFNGTSNASATQQNDPVRSERADYFDAGVSQTLAPGLQVGVDGYYKQAKNELDDGLFGQSLILSAFNYARADIYGVEFTGNYTLGNFSTYANVAYSVAEGRDWNSAQFLFSPADLAYVQNHWVYLDHDQRVSGSFGASYLFKESKRSATRVYVDALYGSGLRADGGGTENGLPTGNPIPNGTTVPSYYSVNCGAEQSFNITKKQILKARFDIVNITDAIDELRNGSGIGVNAAQYAPRIGFFGSLSYQF